MGTFSPKLRALFDLDRNRFESACCGEREDDDQSCHGGLQMTVAMTVSTLMRRAYTEPDNVCALQVDDARCKRLIDAVLGVPNPARRRIAPMSDHWQLAKRVMIWNDEPPLPATGRGGGGGGAPPPPPLRSHRARL